MNIKELKEAICAVTAILYCAYCEKYTWHRLSNGCWICKRYHM